MKFTTETHLKNLFKEFFVGKIESVDRAVRGEEDDYPEENEGPGTTYEAAESVDRNVRGEEDDRPEENEGPGTTYEHLKFETNLYADGQADKVSGKEDVAHGAELAKDTYKGDEELDEAADEEKKDDDEKEFKFGEGKMPSLKSFFAEGQNLIVIPVLGTEPAKK